MGINSITLCKHNTLESMQGLLQSVKAMLHGHTFHVISLVLDAYMLIK